ncbi:MAG TPA: glycoside hydrolase, partial [Bryobacteraceae bacterium]|nr:glycoside hydrolase [Bryobacteraceae bacterium]
FNDGDNWQPLRLNMPAISIRDLVVHDQDLVAGTHGRGFWILDDISPLRQMSAEIAASSEHLFQAGAAYRFRWNTNTDTPLPPEEPAGQNPPDGAIVYYYLKTAAASPVTLEILDTGGKLVRRYSSDDKPEPVDPTLPVPTYWVRPPAILPATAGMHRFVWDLRYPSPDALEHEYPISAIYRDTPREPRGVIALPGQYSVRLTANGRSLTQPLTVTMDPRVNTPPGGLQQQFTLATRLIEMMHRDFDALMEVRAVRGRLKALYPELDKQAADLEVSLTKLNGELSTVLGFVQGADATPTPQMAAAVTELDSKLQGFLATVSTLKAKAR